MKSTIHLHIFLISLISVLSPVIAWGDEGHKTVGQIAQNFLQPDIAKKVANLFQDRSFGGKLSLAALWADDVKHQNNFFWSRPLHYMDTHDNPGKSCSINIEKDCPGNRCVVSAIANYTTQLDCTNGYDKSTRDIALRFLTHFIGDITQPLHVSGHDGGIKVPVIFEGKHEKFHSIWDTQMVDKRLEDFGSDFVQYANFLTKEIQSGKYASERNSWVSCISRPKAATLCPLTWAIDTNAINCPFVWDTINEDPDIDLGEGYYQAAAPIIDKQISKGGYRLGILLNTILSKNC